MTDDFVAVRLSEAGLALLAAHTGDAQLRRAARRRYKNLVSPNVAALLKGRLVRDVAEAAGIHRTHLSRVLNGKGDLFVRQARRLAAVLDIPLIELLAFLETAEQSTPTRNRG